MIEFHVSSSEHPWAGPHWAPGAVEEHSQFKYSHSFPDRRFGRVKTNI